MLLKKIYAKERRTGVSLSVSQLILKREKPFTEGELIQDCMVAAAEEMCPDQASLFQNISLLALWLEFRRYYNI